MLLQYTKVDVERSLIAPTISPFRFYTYKKIHQSIDENIIVKCIYNIPRQTWSARSVHCSNEQGVRLCTTYSLNCIAFESTNQYRNEVCKSRNPLNTKISNLPYVLRTFRYLQHTDLCLLAYRYLQFRSSSTKNTQRV